jgi:hypothetical protein
VIFLGATTRATLFSAVGFLVDGRPSATLGFLLRNAAMLITFFDVLGLPLLFSRVTRLVATRHVAAPVDWNIRFKTGKGSQFQSLVSLDTGDGPSMHARHGPRRSPAYREESNDGVVRRSS